jgi:protein-disulfide isomerase
MPKFKLSTVYFLLFTVLLTLTACGSSSGVFLNLEPLANGEKIAVIEFSDFNCPACKGAYPISREVRHLPGVHFEYRHFPLDIPGHEESRAAANAYECAAEQGYAEAWETALFDNQGQFSDELFAKLPQSYGYAADGKFDSATYATCLTKEKYADKIQAGYRDAIQAGLNSTPSFVVNGQIVRGASQLVEAVQSELAKAATTPAK